MSPRRRSWSAGCGRSALSSARDAARFVPLLKPGQRLVSREGDLWRWDGFAVAANAPTGAARRLAERNRLAEIESELRPRAREAEAKRAGRRRKPKPKSPPRAQAEARARASAGANCSTRPMRARERHADAERELNQITHAPLGA